MRTCPWSDTAVAALTLLETSLQLLDPPEKGMDGYDCGVLEAGARLVQTLHIVAQQPGDKRVDITGRAMATDAARDAMTASQPAPADTHVEHSVGITAAQPFSFTPHVSYGPIKRSSGGNRCVVSVTATIAASSLADIEVESIKVVAGVSGSAKVF